MWKRFRLLLAFVLVLQLTLPIVANAAEDTELPIWGEKINYLALGDSLAAGMDENSGIGLGYTDFLATTLTDMGVLDFYTNDFAVPGYKTIDVLADITGNTKITIDGKGEVALQQAIKDADLITLTMGANDIFAHISKDATTGEFLFNQQAVFAEIQQIGKNYTTFINEVVKLNPDAQVFVMGYYNSFPYAAAELQLKLNTLVNILDNTISTAVTAGGGVFVPVAEVIASDVSTYLPNPNNVHLSEAGYEIVAGEFLEKIESDYDWNFSNVIDLEITSPTSIVLSWAAASDNVGVIGYKVYADDKLVAEFNANEHTFIYDYILPGNTYTFTVKAIDAAGNESVINPKHLYKTENPNTFKDVTGHWASGYIYYVAAKEIMNGYSDDTFKPENTITRVQAASIITRALGLTAKEAAPFADVKGYEAKTQTEIAAAYEAGIIKGVNGQFKPGNPVTRKQLALMLSRAYTYVHGTAYEGESIAPYTDLADVDIEAKQAITMLYDFEIVSRTNEQFNPNGSTKRSHSAKMFTNFVPLLTD